MTIAKGKIGNALTSTASDHVVAVAADIYDEAAGKYQSEINAGKVDKVTGKGLSTNDFDNTAKGVADSFYVSNIKVVNSVLYTSGITVDATKIDFRNAESSVRAGKNLIVEYEDRKIVTMSYIKNDCVYFCFNIYKKLYHASFYYDKTLGEYIGIAEILDLDKKVDKVTGKGLSTNDYTNDEKAKVASAYSVASDANTYTDGGIDNVTHSRTFANIGSMKVGDVITPVVQQSQPNTISQLFERCWTGDVFSATDFIAMEYEGFVRPDGYKSFLCVTDYDNELDNPARIIAEIGDNTRYICEEPCTLFIIKTNPEVSWRCGYELYQGYNHKASYAGATAQKALDVANSKVEEAPKDGKEYVRKNGAWVEKTGISQYSVNGTTLVIQGSARVENNKLIL